MPTAPYIVLAMQGSQPNRAVPLERAIAIANAVNEAGYHTVYIGGGNERAFADSICAAAGPDNVNLAGETTLVEAMETVRRAAGAIMIDSGPMNIASLVNIPIVGLYGPSDPAEHRPWSQCATVVGRGPCGCSKAGCRFRAGPGSCMMELDARQIVSELRRMLSTSDRTCA